MYQVIRSPKRKTISIIIKENGNVIFRVPKFATQKHIDDAYARHKNWIIKKQFIFKQKYASVPQPLEYSKEQIKFFKEQALKFLSQRVELYSKQTGLLYSKVKISRAERQWGSCTGKNILSFPWRLILAPFNIIDYVIAHELAHIKHKNHSKYFWGLVASICPNYKIYRKWLKNHGYLLVI